MMIVYLKLMQQLVKPSPYLVMDIDLVIDQ